MFDWKLVRPRFAKGGTRFRRGPTGRAVEYGVPLGFNHLIIKINRFPWEHPLYFSVIYTR